MASDRIAYYVSDIAKSRCSFWEIFHK